MIADTPRRSELERKLLDTPSYHFDAMVKELDVLRDVILGRIGTAAQRNALLRIIKANAPGGRLVTLRLASQLGLTCQVNMDDGLTFTSYEALFRPTVATQEPEDENDEDGVAPL